MASLHPAERPVKIEGSVGILPAPRTAILLVATHSEVGFPQCDTGRMPVLPSTRNQDAAKPFDALTLAHGGRVPAEP
jgi:hypothetical protein